MQNSSLAIYPSAGYEGGHNLNQPSTLFKENVDLSNWDGISRGVTGVIGEFYRLSKNPSADDVWVFTVDASYQSRILFEPEPFVTVADVKGVAAYVVAMSRTPRPEAEVHVAWNFAKYAGLTVQYKYGSLPPLFQFVDHQVTVGLTIQAKQAK